MKDKKQVIVEKIKYYCKECGLLIMIVASSVGLTIAGIAQSIAGGESLKFDKQKPYLASVLMPGDDKGELPEENIYELEDVTEEDVPEWPTEEVTEPLTEIITEMVTNEAGSEVVTEIVTEVPTEAPTEAPTGYPTEFVEKEKEKPRSDYYEDPGVRALTTSYPYEKVKDKYFKDALFIGDSRIEGLKIYSELADDAEFYCKEGTTIYRLLVDKMATIEVDGEEKDVTIIKALKKKTFGKIYIMVGINELGYRTTADFAEKYADVVDKIRRLQPEAVIYVCGIMNVTESYSDSRDTVNNENINAKNVEIAKLADGMNVFYLDVNPDLSDKNYNIKEKYSWDGVHLKAEYYKLWVKFLKNHAVVR